MSKGVKRLGLGLLTLGVLAVLLRPERPPGPTGGWLSDAGLEPRFAILSGLRVRYVRAGSGPPVVLIHGLASSIFTWRDVLPALALRHEVVALDLPGFGGSDQPPDLEAELYPGLVVSLMDRLELDRASLVGNSLGGAVAVQVAVTAPDRVDRLALIDAAGFNLKPADRPWLLRAAASWPAGLLLEHPAIGRRLVLLALRQVFHDDTRATDERVNEYLAPLLRPGAIDSLRSLLASRMDADGFAAVVPKVQAPTLVLWGREDAWIPVEHAERFVTAIPDARLVVLESCGHLPQEEHPEEVCELLLEFLARPPSPLLPGEGGRSGHPARLGQGR